MPRPLPAALKRFDPTGKSAGVLVSTIDPPIAAWLHRGPNSRASVAVTFPGTYKAISLTRVQVTKLRRALQEAEGLLLREPDPAQSLSIDLMKRVLT